jgi:hypothetical protein
MAKTIRRVKIILFDVKPRDFKSMPLTYQEKLTILNACRLELQREDLSEDRLKTVENTIEFLEKDIRWYH